MLITALIAVAATTAAAPFSLSVDNRVGKHAYVAAEVSAYASRPSEGLRAGYFLSPDTVLELTHARLSSQYAGDDVTGTATDLGYKTFFSNSLYGHAGLSHQTWAVDDRKYGRTAATVQVGNQWQWRAATAGCDWLGYLLPLSGSAPVANGPADRFRFVRAYAGYSF
jgi:hypothetical protein